MQAAEGRRADAMALGFFGGVCWWLGGAAACGRACCVPVEMGEGGGGRAGFMPAWGAGARCAALHAVARRRQCSVHAPNTLQNLLTSATHMRL